MGYGDAYSDSVEPITSRNADIIGVTAAARDLTGHESGEAGPEALRSAALGPKARSIACEIRHPLSAIMANANAARHWLSRPDPNLAEALAALARIVKDSARIDDMI